MVESLPVNAGDLRDAGLIPGPGRSPRGGGPLQDSRLENPRDRGAWWATVHGVAKSRTRLSNLTFTFIYYNIITSLVLASTSVMLQNYHFLFLVGSNILLPESEE